MKKYAKIIRSDGVHPYNWGFRIHLSTPIDQISTIHISLYSSINDYMWAWDEVNDEAFFSHPFNTDLKNTGMGSANKVEQLEQIQEYLAERGYELI